MDPKAKIQLADIPRAMQEVREKLRRSNAELEYRRLMYRLGVRRLR